MKYYLWILLFIFPIHGSILRSPLIVSEAMADPIQVPDSRGEFLELYNSGNNAFESDSVALSVNENQYWIYNLNLPTERTFLLCRDSAYLDSEFGLACHGNWPKLSLSNSSKILVTLLIYTKSGFDSISTTLPQSIPGVSWENTMEEDENYSRFIRSESNSLTGDKASPGTHPGLPGFLEPFAGLDSGSLSITEFCPAPQEPNPEWIEIKNISDKTIPLAQVQYNGKILHGPPADPGETIVLTADSSAFNKSFNNHREKVRVIQVSPWDALKNTGDTITLHLGEDVIHQTSYSSTVVKSGSCITWVPQSKLWTTIPSRGIGPAGSPGFQESFAAQPFLFSSQRVYNPDSKAQMTIEYGSPPGQLMEIAVFDLEGNRVRNLCKSCSRSGTITWDGRDQYGNLVATGPYILLGSQTNSRIRHVITVVSGGGWSKAILIIFLIAIYQSAGYFNNHHHSGKLAGSAGGGSSTGFIRLGLSNNPATLNNFSGWGAFGQAFNPYNLEEITVFESGLYRDWPRAGVSIYGSQLSLEEVYLETGVTIQSAYRILNAWKAGIAFSGIRQEALGYGSRLRLNDNLGMIWEPTKNYRAGAYVHSWIASKTDSEARSTFHMGMSIQPMASTSIHFELHRTRWKKWRTVLAQFFRISPNLSINTGMASGPFELAVGVELQLGGFSLFSAARYHRFLGSTRHFGTGYQSPKNPENGIN